MTNTQTTETTYDDVLAVIQAAVEARPDAMNPKEEGATMCLNIDAKGNHCIAAQALVDLNLVTDDDLRRAFPSLGITDLLAELSVGGLTEGAWTLLEDAQRHFDDHTTLGNTWSEAWEAFEPPARG